VTADQPAGAAEEAARAADHRLQVTGRELFAQRRLRRRRQHALVLRLVRA